MVYALIATYIADKIFTHFVVTPTEKMLTSISGVHILLKVDRFEQYICSYAWSVKQ